VLSDHLSWGTVYALLALLLGVGLITTLLAPEPEGTPPPPRSLGESIVRPFADLLSRRRSWALLAIVALYKIGDSVAGHVQIPFLGAQHLHFANTEIGVIKKGIGLGATIVGALVGGGLVARFGLKRSLIAFGILQAAPNALYAWLAEHGRDPAVVETLSQLSWVRSLESIGVTPATIPMAAVITVDELMNGLGTAAFVALLMSLCNKRFTAMQYALLSSLSNIAGRLLAGSSGVLAEAMGWPAFFGLTVLLALPALALLFLVDLDAEPREEAT
ncbi:MAG: hypothetical protein K8H88_09820, partial [Sandaracinaceae bacterium]|nr:hypothetical protein [Sandaracinaceae bacterium]